MTTISVPGGFMGIARTWVFPILRILLVALVAAALIKLAFLPRSPCRRVSRGPDRDDRGADNGGGVGDDHQRRGRLGTVAADPAVPMKATAAGTVNKIFIAQGRA